MIGAPQVYTAAKRLYAVGVCEGANSGKYVLLQLDDEDPELRMNEEGDVNADVFLVWPTPDKKLAGFETKEPAQLLADRLNRHAQELKNGDRFRVELVPVRDPVS